MTKRKVLFISEDITLSQVVRLVELAKSISSIYEVHFACSNSYPFVFANTEFTHWRINNIGAKYMQDKLDSGSRIYSEEILLGYIEEELSLYSRINPDFIVSDFRWSVSVSAPFQKIPYAIIINSYWNLSDLNFKLPLPDHPIINYLGYSISQFFFPIAAPFFFYYNAIPINRVRKKFGLASLGSLQEVLVSADYTLYPDIPQLLPLKKLKENEVFLGPIIWSPKIDYNFSWDEQINGLPLVYYTHGSSGNKKLNQLIINSLKKLPVRILFSSAGSKADNNDEYIRSADLIAGDFASRSSVLVICNGGSSTAYQALNEGTPILGLPSNLDQQLAVRMIEKTGAGSYIPYYKMSENYLVDTIKLMLNESSYKLNAKKIQQEFKNYNYKTIFPSWINDRFK